MEEFESDFKKKRMQRNREMAEAFKKRRNEFPGATNAELVRYLHANFNVSETTARIALKEEGIL